MLDTNSIYYTLKPKEKFRNTLKVKLIAEVSPHTIETTEKTYEGTDTIKTVLEELSDLASNYIGDNMLRFYEPFDDKILDIPKTAFNRPAITLKDIETIYIDNMGNEYDVDINTSNKKAHCNLCHKRKLISEMKTVTNKVSEFATYTKYICNAC